MPPRKRRRSQAFPESDGEDRGVTSEHLVSGGNDLDKERDVWDSFREEHFEAVDQMPLTLHRHYALMQELDQQAHGHIGQLHFTLQRYISKRREMADQLRIPGLLACSSKLLPGALKEERLSLPRSLPSLTLPMSLGSTSLGKLRIATQSPTLFKHAESQQTTQQILVHIAWLADELFRASEEKVNLSQAAFDSVDRHVRILDQAITEQEASSLGTRPSHLTPGNLPELTVNRWARPSRTTTSPVDEDDDDLAFSAENSGYTGPIGDGITPEAPAFRKQRKRGCLPVRGRQKEGSSLTITLPAQPGPPEQLFCYCNRVSFGQMVACDFAKCEIEWFHFDCLDLKETPEGSWYCSEKCRAGAQRKRK